MSFNRLKYDNCSYKKNLEESMSIGCYQLYGGKYDNKNNCRIDFGIIGGNNVSMYKGNLVDLESDLRGQTRLNSLCPSNKYMPRCKQPCDSGLPSGPIDCNSELVNLPTRQMICYKPVTYAPTPSGAFCPGLYETKNRNDISKYFGITGQRENIFKRDNSMEGFFQECSTGDTDSYPKWQPPSGEECPMQRPRQQPNRCNRCKLPFHLCTCNM